MIKPENAFICSRSFYLFLDLITLLLLYERTNFTCTLCITIGIVLMIISFFFKLASFFSALFLLLISFHLFFVDTLHLDIFVYFVFSSIKLLGLKPLCKKPIQFITLILTLLLLVQAFSCFIKKQPNIFLKLTTLDFFILFIPVFIFKTNIENLFKKEKKHRNVDIFDLSLLSKSELAICQSIWDGFTVKETAYRLGFSDGTIRVYLSRMYKKLNINDLKDLYFLKNQFEVESQK